MMNPLALNELGPTPIFALEPFNYLCWQVRKELQAGGSPGCLLRDPEDR